MTLIKLNPVRSKTFTAQEFVKEMKNLKTSDIERTTIIPGKLGSRDLGKIEVKFKHTLFYE